MSDPVISKGSLILVTGASGFIGSHVVDQVLAAGYKVRGTCRDTTKTEWVQKYFEGKYGKDTFEAVVVEDFSKAGAFDQVVKGCAGIAHVASDMTFRANPEEVIPPVVDGVKHLLKAAAAESSVKRFVLTSSSTAATMPKPGEKFRVDASTWNDEAIEVAQRPPPYEASRSFWVYGASKALAEKASWDFVNSNKPGFALTTVLPNFNIGPILIPDHQTGSSSGLVKGVYEGKPDKIERLKNFPPQYFVDVQDVAKLHVAGLTRADVKGERLLAFTSPINFNIFMDVMKKISPDKTWPEKLDKPGEDLSEIDTARSEEVLRALGSNGFTSLEESVRNCVQ